MNQSGYTIFRLPALIYHQGTFLAFCEGRYGTADSSVADMVLRRGTLKGSKVTWGQIQVVASEKEKNIRLHNHVPLIDHQKNVILLLYKSADRSLFLIKSTDIGQTWSKPVDIADQIFKKAPNDVKSFSPGPGHGVQLKSGRLVIQGCTNVKNDSGGRACHATVIVSDDHGTTWQMGGYVPTATSKGVDVQTNETAVAALSNGLVYLNSRTLGYDQPRGQSFSQDGGETFGPPQLVSNLIEPKNLRGAPAGCEGAVLGFQAPEKSLEPWRRCFPIQPIDIYA
ncbi:sialidase-4-like isoform X2 [Amphiura filiformis]